MKALIYTRVSADAKGTGRSVAEQEAECRAWCASQGWSVADVIAEPNRSASRHAKRDRPEWERVKAELALGEIDVLVTWEASRAQRDLDAYTELRRLCEQHGVRWSYSGTVYNFSDRSDRFRTGLDALMAEDEADRTRERVLRAMRANADQGRPHGRRPFGYERIYDPTSGTLIGQEPHPTEAPIVTSIVQSVLRGDSLRSIADRLNAAGERTSTGGSWVPSTVRRVALNPIYAGLRVHQGKVTGPATWAPIITTAEHDQVTAILTAPERRSTRQRDRVHLLSGVAFCGLCGATMNAAPDRSDGKPVTLVYRCRRYQHVTIRKVPTDAFVVAVVLERLARADGLAELAHVPPPGALSARAEIDQLRARLDAAAEEYASGDMTAQMLSRVESRILAEIADRERRARFAGLPSVVTDVSSAPDPAAVWDGLTLEQQAAVIRSLMGITIAPAARPSRSYDPGRVHIEWKV